MSGVTLEEDAIDEILYLARTNETAGLESYLSELSSQTKHARADLIAAAIDPYSKNTALHYAAANGHVGKFAESETSWLTQMLTAAR
jgi:glutamate mutase epsilon subunit